MTEGVRDAATNTIERIARIISEHDRLEADEAPDFAEWHWEGRAGLAREIVHTLRHVTESEWKRALLALDEYKYEAPPEGVVWPAVINAILAESSE